MDGHKRVDHAQISLARAQAARRRTQQAGGNMSFRQREPRHKGTIEFGALGYSAGLEIWGGQRLVDAMSRYEPAKEGDGA